MSVTISGLSVNPDGILEGDVNEYLYHLFCDRVIVSLKGCYRQGALDAFAADVREGCAITPDGSLIAASKGIGNYTSIFRMPGMDATVYAVPRTDFGIEWPRMRIQFNARASRTYTFAEIKLLSEDICEQMGFEWFSIEPAEIDLCVDVPASWSDVVRGEKKGRINCGRKPEVNPEKTHPHGIHFKKRPGANLSWIVYDLRQRENRVTEWRESWRNLKIDPSEALTRVEARFMRRRFKADGISDLSQLTPAYLEDLFRWFATAYLRYEENGRVNPLWEEVSRTTCSPLLLRQVANTSSLAA